MIGGRHCGITMTNPPLWMSICPVKVLGGVPGTQPSLQYPSNAYHPCGRPKSSFLIQAMVGPSTRGVNQMENLISLSLCACVSKSWKTNNYVKAVIRIFSQPW